MISRRFVAAVRRFLRDADGTASVEFVLWLPVWVLIISLTADASLVFSAKSQVLRVIQDANRATSVGRIRTVQETENYVRLNIGEYASHARITSVVTSGVISTTVVIPTNDLIATGLLGGLTGRNVTINAQHMLEV